MKNSMKTMKGLVQWNRKVATKNCFLFEGLFDSKRSAETTMDIGAIIIGMIQTNTKGFVRIPPRSSQMIVQEVLI